MKDERGKSPGQGEKSNRQQRLEKLLEELLEKRAEEIRKIIVDYTKKLAKEDKSYWDMDPNKLRFEARDITNTMPEVLREKYPAGFQYWEVVVLDENGVEIDSIGYSVYPNGKILNREWSSNLGNPM